MRLLSSPGAVSFLLGGALCAPVPARPDGHNRTARSIPRREGGAFALLYLGNYYLFPFDKSQI